MAEMFKNTIKTMAKYEEITNKWVDEDSISEEEYDYLNYFPFYFAKVLYEETPNIEYVTKYLEIIIKENER